MLRDRVVREVVPTPVFAPQPDPGRPQEWELLLRLGGAAVRHADPRCRRRTHMDDLYAHGHDRDAVARIAEQPR